MIDYHNDAFLRMKIIPGNLYVFVAYYELVWH